MSLDWDSDSMTGKLTAIAMEEIDQGTEHLFVNWFFDVQGDKGEQWCGLDDLISKECSLFRDVYDDNRGEMKIRAEMISCLKLQAIRTGLHHLKTWIGLHLSVSLLQPD